METLTPSSDTKKAADLLQNLSLDSEPKTTVVPEPAKSGHALAKVPKPFNLNASFIPNGHPSTAYYYGGYDGQGDWNSYSRYMNLNGGMTQGVWGDGSSYLYHQGYGYTPYGAPMQHDDKFYGLQQYHYPSYYQSPTSADGSFAANKINAQPGKVSTAISDEHTPSSGVINNGSSVGVVNEDSTNNNGLKDFLSSSKPSLLNSNDSTYQRAGFPVYSPLPGHQDPRVVPHGTQPALPSEALIFSDKKSYDGAKIGLSSPAVPVKKTSSQRNTAIPQPLPQSMASPSSGLLVQGVIVS